MIRKITDRLYQGSFDYALEEIKEKGITAIVNVCNQERFTEVQTLQGIKYFHIPLVDCSPIPSWLIDFIKELMKTDIVFVHCCAGAHRSAVIAYFASGLDFEKARDLMPGLNDSECVINSKIVAFSKTAAKKVIDEISNIPKKVKHPLLYSVAKKIYNMLHG